MTVSATPDNYELTWNGGLSNAWNLTFFNWIDGSASPKTFLDGDAVTFDLTGPPESHTIKLSGTGKTVADMTVTGTHHWTFDGNITANKNLTALGGRSGKLVLGGTDTFTGTAKFTGDNWFDGGVDIQSGTMIVSSAANLGTDLNRLKFVPNESGTVSPTLQVTEGSDLLFFGDGSLSQRLVFSGGQTGTIQLEKDATFTIQNNAGNNQWGTALSVANGATLVLETAEKAEFRFIDNSGSRGGALRNTGTLTLGDAVFSHNDANADATDATTALYNVGGAVYMDNGTLNLNGDVEFSHNKAYRLDGAIHLYQGTITDNATGSVLFDHNTAQYGGAIYVDSLNDTNKTLSLTGAVFTHNTAAIDPAYTSASVYGGAMYVAGGTVNLTDVEFSYNSAVSDQAGPAADAYGGALYVAGGTVTLNGADFTGNSATATNTEGYGHVYGGVLYLSGGDVTFTGDTRFDSNKATSSWSGHLRNGGAIYYTGGTLQFTGDTLFTGNHADDGGGAISARNLDLSTSTGKLTFTANASTYGGAIFSSSSVSLAGNSFFKDNLAGANGGAIAVWSGNDTSNPNTVTLDTSVGAIGFSGNKHQYNFTTQTGTANSIHMAQNTLLKLEGGGDIYFDDPISSQSTGTYSGNTLTKSGAGFVQFVGDSYLNRDASHTYGGGSVAVDGGTFRVVDGANFYTYGTGATFTTATGTTLAGGGTITAQQGFTLSGTISPDTDQFAIPDYDYTLHEFAAGRTAIDDTKKIGTLTLDGNVKLDAATVALDIASDTSLDQIDVIGDVTFGGINTVTANFTGPIALGDYTFLTSTGTVADPAGLFNVTLPNSMFEGYNLLARGSGVYHTNANDGLMLTSDLKPIDLTWTGAEDNKWTNDPLESASGNWTNGDATNPETKFRNGDTVTFDETASRTAVVLTTNVTVADMTVKGGAAYTFTGAFGITGAGTLTVEDNSTATLDNSGRNEFDKVMIENGSTLRTGTIIAEIFNNGTLIFHRDGNQTFDNAISGDGVTKMTGNDTLTLAGTTIQENAFEQSAGTVSLLKTWTGNYTQTDGLLTGNGTITGNLVSAKNIRPGDGENIGTLTVEGSADLIGATLRFKVDGTYSSSIVGGGNVTIGTATSITTIDILNFTPGTYTLLTGATDFWNDENDFTTLVGGSPLGGRQKVNYVNNDKTAVKVTLTISGNETLTWAGTNGDLWRAPLRWMDTAPNDETFIDGDTVIFQNLGTQSIGLGTSDVTVANMTVNGGAYTFSGDGVGITTDTTGSLALNGGSVTLASTGSSRFVDGISIASPAVLQLDNGKLVGDIDNAGELIFNRADEFTFDNKITGNGVVRQIGSGNITFNGASQTGKLEQTDGTITLANVWTGDIDQTAGILSGNGTLTGNAKIEDTVAPTGTLTLDDATLHSGSTLHIGNLGMDVLTVTNTLIFAPTGGKIGVDLGNWSQIDNAVIIDDSIPNTIDLDATFEGVTLNGAALSGRRSATLAVQDGDLLMTTMALNIGLLWTGAASDAWNTTAINWCQADDPLTNDTFIDDDDVTFGDTTGHTTIFVQETGVKVGEMNVEGDTDYIFNGGDIDATGALTKNGASTLTLNNANSFDGGTNLNAGRINLGDDLALGIHEVRMAADTTLGFTGNRTISNNVILNGNAVIDTAGHASTMSGEISGGSGFDKIGAGTLILTGENAYTDPTTVSNGVLQIGNGGDSGSLVSDVTVASGARLVFDRSDTSEYSGKLSGTGSATKNGAGTLTLSGDSSNYDGTFTLAAGSVHLTSTLDGTFEQNTDTTFTSADGATLNTATFKGTAEPTGTLNITGNAVFDSATVSLGRLTSADMITTAGNAFFTDTTINVDATNASGVYTLIDYVSVTGETGVSVNASNLGSGDRAGHFFDADDSALKYEVATGPMNLTWTGSSPNWNTSDTNTNWTNGRFDTYFRPNDSVLFDASASVVVQSGGVDVTDMIVTGNVDFSGGQIRATGNIAVDPSGVLGLIVGNAPAIVAGTVDFGGTLNITGYTPDESSPHDAPKNIQTLVAATIEIANFDPSVSVADQAQADFLAAKAFREGNEIKVETTLTWDSTDPNRPTHGDFTINGTNSFTLGAVLADNSASTNKRSGWDGNTFTKKGDGTLILIAANTYTGATIIESGMLQLGDAGTKGSVAGNIVNNPSLVFYRSDGLMYDGAISGSGTTTQKGSGVLTLSGDSSTYTGAFVQTGGGVHLADTAILGGTFTQNAGTRFTSADGATLNDANFSGNVTPTGTLKAASANFDGATIILGTLGTDMIAVSGTADFSTASTIRITTSGVATGSYTLLDYGTLAGRNVTANATSDANQRGGLYFDTTDTALKYDLITGNGRLTLERRDRRFGLEHDGIECQLDHRQYRNVFRRRRRRHIRQRRNN